MCLPRHHTLLILQVAGSDCHDEYYSVKMVGDCDAANMLRHFYIEASYMAARSTFAMRSRWLG